MSKGSVHLLLAIAIALLFIAVIVFTLTKQPEKNPIPDKVPVVDNTSQSPLETRFKREGIVIKDPSINNPEVIKLPDGSFRMFAHRATQMLSFKSADGKNFYLESGIRLQGGMPTLVTLPDGKFRMYFNSFPDNSIKSAVSKDGFNFEIEEGVRLTKGSSGSLDQGGIIHPGVLQLKDGKYKMYYDGVSTTSQNSGPDSWNIMSASSDDGLTWKKDSGTRIPTGCQDDEETEEDNSEDTNIIEEDDCLNGAWNVNARLEKDKIVLYFSADVDSVENSGIWKTSSNDGINFIVESKVLGQEESFKGKRVESGKGPKGVPQDPFVLETDEGLRLFYWTPEGGILSAISN